MKTRPLKFKFISDDGRRITYRAVVSDLVRPDRPVYALTVTTGSPHDAKGQAEFQRFLKQLKAAFAIVDPAQGKPPPSSDRPIAFSPKNDILFIAELVTIQARGIFEVESQVDSAIDPSRDSTIDASGKSLRQYDGSIFSKKWQKFHYLGQGLIAANVTCSRGAVMVRPGPPKHGPVEASHNPPKNAWTRPTDEIKITSHYSSRSDFTIHANFKEVASGNV